jgi:hypothetical protein
MRLLGRHLIPVLPFLIILLAIGLNHCLSGERLWIRAIGVTAVIVLLVSALEIRFATRHQRDDYRSAAAETRRAISEGKTVWWAGDVATAFYYKVPIDSPDLILSSRLPDNLNSISPPDLICLSKPDIYDPSGKISGYLRGHVYRESRIVPSFRFFEPINSPPNSP